MLRRLAPLILLLGGPPLGLGAGCAASAGESAAASAADLPQGLTTLPPVPLRTLEGAEVTLPGLVQGRVGLISLWATWCEPCLAEFPALQRLAAATRPEELTAVAVSIGEPASTVAPFVARHGLRYRHLLDEHFALADALGQRRVPVTLVVDAGGRVRHVGGAFDEAALDVVRGLLGR